jgi:hypothetical protein
MKRLLAFAVLALLVVPAVLQAGGGLWSGKVESQLGLKFAEAVNGDGKVGQTFQASVVDPSKLGAQGFAGLKQGDVVTLKITGPNNQFEVVHGASRFSRAFSLNTQGIVSPRTVAAPAALPAK